MLSLNSMTSSWTSPEAGSPFPWYLIKKSIASCSLPFAMRYRGDSGIVMDPMTAMTLGNAWSMRGIRQEKLEFRKLVPKVTTAAGRAPPYQPMLYRPVHMRQWCHPAFQSRDPTSAATPPVRWRNFHRVRRYCHVNLRNTKTEYESTGRERSQARSCGSDDGTEDDE